MEAVESVDEGPRPTEHAGREAESPTHTAFRTLLQEASAQFMNEQKRILQRLWEALLENQESAMRIVSDQRDMIQRLQEDVYSIRTEAVQTAEEVKAMREANEQLRQQQEETMEELKQTREQLEMATRALSANSPRTSPQLSYAEVTRTTPTGAPAANALGLSPMWTTVSATGETLFCTIDTSSVSEEDKSKVQVGGIRQAIEDEVRKKEDRRGWQCAAVLKDTRCADRIKVICRDEKEMNIVKEAAEKTAVQIVRVLRDQLYPVQDRRVEPHDRHRRGGQHTAWRDGGPGQGERGAIS